MRDVLEFVPKTPETKTAVLDLLRRIEERRGDAWSVSTKTMFAVRRGSTVRPCSASGELWMPSVTSESHRLGGIAREAIFTLRIRWSGC